MACSWFTLTNFRIPRSRVAFCAPPLQGERERERLETAANIFSLFYPPASLSLSLPPSLSLSLSIYRSRSLSLSSPSFCICTVGHVSYFTNSLCASAVKQLATLRGGGPLNITSLGDKQSEQERTGHRDEGKSKPREREGEREEERDKRPAEHHLTGRQTHKESEQRKRRLGTATKEGAKQQ